jgi:hypothetical protein
VTDANGSWTSADRSERIALTWIVVVAIVVRGAALFQPMRYDEGVTWALFVGRSWWTILHWYPNPNNHVLFSLLAKATSSLAPSEPWAMRLPAFVAGVAVVPLTWAVGRRLAGRAVGLIGAALAAASTSLVLYSVNARGHTIVVALSLVLVLVGDRLRDGGGGRWREWIAFSVIGGVGLFTVMVMIYPIGAVSLWIALDALQRARRSGEWRDAGVRLLRLGAAGIGALAIAGLLYAPIIRASGVHVLTSSELALPLTWTKFARLLPRFVYELTLTWTSPLSGWWVVGVFGLAVVGLRRERKARGTSLALATIVWCVALLVESHRTPFVRFWLFALPLFLLAVARGLTRLPPLADRFPKLRRVGAAEVAAALATVMGVVALNTRAAELSDDTGTFPAAKAVSALVGPQLRAGDRVFAVIPLNGPLLYYLGVTGRDTSLLNTVPAKTRRAFLVLDPSRGQTLGWAVRVGIIDPTVYRQPVLLGKPGGAEVWVTEK